MGVCALLLSDAPKTRAESMIHSPASCAAARSSVSLRRIERGSMTIVIRMGGGGSGDVVEEGESDRVGVSAGVDG